MTNFTAAAADYLATRRAMGYKLADHDSLLRQFAGHLEGAGAVHLTVSHALTWATQQSQAAPVWVAAKLGVVRGFARYLSALDPSTEIPPVGLLTEPSHMIVPHIYADEEVSRLLEAAGRLHPEHRADTYRTVIALLAVTGMRVGEAVRLDDDDIDFEQGLLTIRRSKYGKSRQLPLHASTLAALAAYGRRRDLRPPRRKAPSFFTSTVGTRLLRDNVSTVFPRLVRECGLTAGLAGRRPPRLHDYADLRVMPTCAPGKFRIGAGGRHNPRPATRGRARLRAVRGSLAAHRLRRLPIWASGAAHPVRRR